MLLSRSRAGRSCTKFLDAVRTRLVVGGLKQQCRLILLSREKGRAKDDCKARIPNVSEGGIRVLDRGYALRRDGESDAEERQQLCLYNRGDKLSWQRSMALSPLLQLDRGILQRRKLTRHFFVSTSELAVVEPKEMMDGPMLMTATSECPFVRTRV